MEYTEKEKQLEYLMQSKSFSELSELEQQFVLQETGSEEAYVALRKADQALRFSSPAELTPDPGVLISLQKQFRQKHKKENFLIYIMQFRMPAYATSLLILLGCFVTWLLTGLQVNHTTPLTVASSDTVYVNTKSDTLFVDRVVYRYVSTREKPEKKLTIIPKRSTLKPDSALSVTMQDKAELEKLLVTGTY